MSSHDNSAEHGTRDRGRKPWYWRVGERPAQLGYIGLWIVGFVVAGFLSAGVTFAPLFNRETQSTGQPVAPTAAPGPPPTLTQERGLRLPAKVVGEKIRAWTPSGFAPVYWTGVNLGSSVPGQDPGAVAATRADVNRWLAGMAEMNVRVVRIYTILDPTFYEALREHNLRNPRRPIYLMHGIWIPEERWYETGNAWDAKVVRETRAEIGRAVAAVHGEAEIAAVPGHASGVYTADVSPWMMGWSFGIEWDPAAVMSTNRKARGRAPFAGVYVRADRDASPMESWIASNLEEIARQEARRGSSVPLTFTNWDTTDPLSHPDEPFDLEDAVSVDAMNIRTTASWPAGYFASFHAYPYYPDFLRLQPSYLRHRRADGTIDPYAGYIADLRRHHRGVPLMITEVGQPTARGCAHLGPLGRRQGCHHETEAAKNLIEMIDAVHEEGGAGTIAFMWLDEWFKFTWNTIDYEIPRSRRALWRNPLTNEEHFGLVAAEPGSGDVVVLDGDDREWASAGVIASADGAVKEVRATSDAENVYLRLKVDESVWRTQRIVIGLDAHRAGNRGLPGLPGTDADADVALVIGPGPKARILHAAWLDAMGMRYGGFANPEQAFVPTRRADLVQGSGAWAPLRQLLSYPFRNPRTGQAYPAEIRDVSSFGWGSTDPADPSFDDRNMIMGRGDVLEIALPWGMTTFSDPSSHQVYELRLASDPRKQVVSRPIDRLGISVAVPGEPLLRTSGYTWPGWEEVQWHERKKAGFSLLRNAFAEHAGPFDADATTRP